MRLAITAMFVITATVIAQEPEGAWGRQAGVPAGNVFEPTEFHTVGMTGETECGFRVGIGQVTAAEHEIADGNFNLGTIGTDRVTVFMPRGAIGLLRAKELNQKDAELLLRPITQRTPEKVER